MEKKRKYFGRVQTKSNNYGEIIKIGVGPQDFELLNSSKGANGWLTIDVKPKQGGGYYAEIYQPNGQYQQQTKAQPSNTVSDDLF